ncbi:1-phosphatidylinositol-4 5-bisphosphate phosphodiesterase 1 [Fusarium beomiforme]|uniref:1-phosphatidylinositol-4 5-bisphosphate phosphodiesterase 1 n=1 Tax=Fusarium beomiforme TaxID=44412 RepID=A0A9P5AQF0_9HYPO|nr:1-phosphatidylinositol-4 5-bisphosphate phosphodiesterase 1 [Fusarium beomiforme]
MPPQGRAPGSCHQRPSETTQEVRAADTNRQRANHRRANLEEIARYIIYPLSQSPEEYMSMDFLDRCRINCEDMDFRTGQVGKRAEPFIQLVQPQVVEQLLREIGAPPLKDRRDCERVLTRI